MQLVVALMGKVESTLLKLCGFGLVALAVYFLFKANVPAATLCAAVGLLLTFLARFSQFKRFKGWGFEAEMWEEKQQEAEKLVESLKKVATLAAREVMLQSIKSGRLVSGKSWEDHWRLFEEIKAAQSGLLDADAQLEIRRSIDRWFLHDMVAREFGALLSLVAKEVENARKAVREKYGNPVSDIPAFQKEMDLLRRIEKPADGLFELAGSRKLVESVDAWWSEASHVLSQHDVWIEIPPDIRGRLGSGPINLLDRRLAA
jgi:hypothetical protein